MALGSALIPVARASDLEAAAQRSSAEKQATPMIQGLAAHARHRWEIMRDHKRLYVEDRLTKCVRARDMQYEPEKLAEIREQGGSEIFMGIVSTKCRTATAWLRDTLLGTGADKPWSISPTPIPEVPPDVAMGMQQIMQQLMQQFQIFTESVQQQQVQLQQQAQVQASHIMRWLWHQRQFPWKHCPRPQPTE